MRYVEAPEDDASGAVSLFLAGGITGCPDWQAQLVHLLRDEDLLLLNPRRAAFSMEPAAAAEQVAWEYRYLRRATAVSFWFPCETLCPIVLYELGAWSMTAKRLFVGTHPDYARRADVVLQTALARPDVVVVHALADLVGQVRRWSREPGPSRAGFLQRERRGDETGRAEDT